MGVLVVFESMFGNTEQVARAVAEGLATRTEVEVVEVGQAPDLAAVDADLVVVGAPTHAFGLSRPQTRQDAARSAPHGLVSGVRGVREWLGTSGRAHCAAATFDTHIGSPNLPGHAGRAAERRMRRLGCRVVEPAESFTVGGTTGPLGDGELERARQWGVHLAEVAMQVGRPAAR